MEAVMAYFKALSHYLHGESGGNPWETHNSQCLCWVSNWVSSKYKSRALLLQNPTWSKCYCSQNVKVTHQVYITIWSHI